MGYKEQVARRFRAQTDRAPHEAMKTARESIAGVQPKTWRISVAREHEHAVLYAIKPTAVAGFLNEPLLFDIIVKTDGDGSVVTASLQSFGVQQQKLLWLIPLSPKHVPGIQVYLRCLEALSRAFDS